MKSPSDYHRCQGYGFEPRESRWRRVDAWMRRLTPGHLLDIGCNQGHWAAQWQARGWECSGVDVNPEAVAQAGTRIRAAVADISQGPLPFAAGAFDLVFAGEVIEHLVDTDGFLREAARLLKPGGRLILTTPNLASFENRVKLLLGKYPRWMDHRLGGAGHVRAYTWPVLRSQLIEHGLVPEKFTGNWVSFLPQSMLDDVRQPWLAWTGRIFPTLSQGLIVMARKARP